ncbi:hypothetical protein QYE76_048071 [Lolium multiflorum]|uniref:Uncharacterized protein n=1 Tax=Lolium multiflorum TaxID=4521 RepID=A0AAD8TSR7_LOLMU|nr:hypothetical protein QYE76_048071 [Lolium multiflorum]
MENYSLLMGAAAMMKMAVEMAAVSMEKPFHFLRQVPNRLLSPILASRWRRLWKMDQLNNTKFYQLGNGGNLIFERDLDALSEHLGRPHPEFFGTQTDDQPGGELQWVVVVDLRGKMEPPTSERIHFSKELDNSRVYANQTHLHLSQQTDAIKMLAKDRNSLRQQRAKKDATIARLCGDPGLAVRNTLLCIPLTTPMISLP